MTEREPDFSRVGRRKERKRSSNLLNILIGVVIVLIIVVATTIVLSNDSDETADGKEHGNEAISKDNPSEDTKDDDQVIDDDNTVEDENLAAEDNQSESSDNTESDKSDESKTNKDTDKDKENSGDSSDSDGSVTSVPSEDELVAESVVNSAWEPIGTTQTGDHVSQYTIESVDWDEKKQALAYATGLPKDSMIFWKIKNGGGPQKSIGIVSSRDSVEKYRVYLEWVDGQGWKPVKMEVLTTLDFEH